MPTAKRAHQLSTKKTPFWPTRASSYTGSRDTHSPPATRTQEPSNEATCRENKPNKRATSAKRHTQKEKTNVRELQVRIDGVKRRTGRWKGGRRPYDVCSVTHQDKVFRHSSAQLMTPCKKCIAHQPPTTLQSRTERILRIVSDASDAWSTRTALRLHYDCAAMPGLRFENGKQKQGRNSFALGAHCIGDGGSLSLSQRDEQAPGSAGARKREIRRRCRSTSRRAERTRKETVCVGVRDVRVCVRTGATATYEESRGAYTLNLCRAVLLYGSAALRRSSPPHRQHHHVCGLLFLATRRGSARSVTTSWRRCSRCKSGREEIPRGPKNTSRNLL